MPILILGIASFLSFGTIVALLLIAEILESRALPQKSVFIAAKPMPLLCIEEAFDPVYCILWEAPIAALQLANASGVAGIPAARLHRIYQAAATRFPEIYDGFAFSQWLQSLIEMKLIERRGSNIVLTVNGQAFLKFRFVTNAMVAA